MRSLTKVGTRILIMLVILMSMFTFVQAADRVSMIDESTGNPKIAKCEESVEFPIDPCSGLENFANGTCAKSEDGLTCECTCAEGFDKNEFMACVKNEA